MQRRTREQCICSCEQTYRSFHRVCVIKLRKWDRKCLAVREMVECLHVRRCVGGYSGTLRPCHKDVASSVDWGNLVEKNDENANSTPPAHGQKNLMGTCISWTRTKTHRKQNVCGECGSKHATFKTSMSHCASTYMYKQRVMLANSLAFVGVNLSDFEEAKCKNCKDGSVPNFAPSH